MCVCWLMDACLAQHNTALTVIKLSITNCGGGEGLQEHTLHVRCVVTSSPHMPYMCPRSTQRTWYCQKGTFQLSGYLRPASQCVGTREGPVDEWGNSLIGLPKYNTYNTA